MRHKDPPPLKASNSPAKFSGAFTDLLGAAAQPHPWISRRAVSATTTSSSGRFRSLAQGRPC
eukprot:6069901-Alexandrium_andersonii.AAC.1